MWLQPRLPQPHLVARRAHAQRRPSGDRSRADAPARRLAVARASRSDMTVPGAHTRTPVHRRQARGAADAESAPQRAATPRHKTPARDAPHRRNARPHPRANATHVPKERARRGKSRNLGYFYSKKSPFDGFSAPRRRCRRLCGGRMSSTSLAHRRIDEDGRRPHLATSCCARWRGMQAALAVWPLTSEERQHRCVNHRLAGSMAACYTWKLAAIALAVAEPRRSEGCVDATAEEACCRQWR